MQAPRFTTRVTRDTVLFLVGLVGIIYETVVVHVDRPTLLILFGGMVGLPVFLHQDEKPRTIQDDYQAETPPGEKASGS